jgi:hypothetical protein
MDRNYVLAPHNAFKAAYMGQKKKLSFFFNYFDYSSPVLNHQTMKVKLHTFLTSHSSPLDWRLSGHGADLVLLAGIEPSVVSP